MGENPAVRSESVDGTQNWSVALGRFNAERHLSLAVVNRGDPAQPIGQGVSIRLGDGRGGFRPGEAVLPGFPAGSVTAADLNGDGLDDLIVQSGDTLVILLASPTGSFNERARIRGGFYGTQVRVADFDRDGNPDLLVATGRTSLSILFGDGTSKFERRMSLPQAYPNPGGDGPQSALLLAAFPSTPEVVDIDGDGYPDIIAPAISLSFESNYKELRESSQLQSHEGSYLVIFKNRLGR